MTNRKLKQLMGDVSEKISFDEDWSLRLKKEMLLNLQSEDEAKRISWSLRWSKWASKMTNVLAPQQLVARPVATFSLILGLFVISGFASVNASRNSLPGDTLYPLKLTAENLKYSLSFSSESKAKVAMNRVANRMGELKIMVGGMSLNNNEAKKEKMVAAAYEIKNNLNLVAKKMQDVRSEVGESEIKTAQEIDAKLTLVKNDLEIVSQNMGTELNAEILALKEQVEKASALTVATINSEVIKNEVKDNNFTDATSTPDATILENDVKENPIITNNTSSEVIFIEDLIVEKEAPKEEFEVKVGE